MSLLCAILGLDTVDFESALLEKLNPNHVPAGSPTGGEFTSGAGPIEVKTVHLEESRKVWVAHHRGLTYTILDSEGNRLGDMDLMISPDGNANIGGIHVKGGPNALGAGAVKNIARRLKELHPEIKSFSGERISGVRGAYSPGSSGAHTSVNVSKVVLCTVDLLKYSYGCVMFDVDPQSEAGQQLRALRDEIPDEDLMAKGRETELHCTVRYGIQDTASEAGIAAYLTTQEPFTITLGQTMVFPPSPQSDNAAVVVVQVISPDLERINGALAAAGNFKPADFDYHPHITLAYCTEEAAEKWDGEDSVEGLELDVDTITIRSKDGSATPVALAGHETQTRSMSAGFDSAGVNQTCPDCWNEFPVEVATCPWCFPVMTSEEITTETQKWLKYNQNHDPSSGEFSSDFVSAAQKYRENPGESTARRQLTALAGHTKEGGSYEHLHPGEVAVYRAGRIASKGTSFTKSLTQAKKKLETGKSKIYTIKLSKADPAIDMNKLDPRSRYSYEREVFVDTRGLDRSRIGTIEAAEKIAKFNPNHDAQGRFSTSLSPFQDHTSKRVQVNQPGHPMHGKVGTVLRQIGNESGVDIPGEDHTHWIKTSNLLGEATLKGTMLCGLEKNWVTINGAHVDIEDDKTLAGSIHGAPLKFDLNDHGQYEWAGGVAPGNVKIEITKAKHSEIVKSAAQFVGERLFSDRPITIKVVWDALKNNHNAMGSSSTSADGAVAQLYVNVKTIKGDQEGLVGTVAHELAHTWQRRNGWGSPDVSIAYHLRTEEIHAEKLGQLMGNEFLTKHGSKFGITPSPWLNTPKYFASMVADLTKAESKGTLGMDKSVMAGKTTCPQCGRVIPKDSQTCANCAPGTGPEITSPTQGIESTPDDSNPTSQPGNLPTPSDIGIKQTDDPLGSAESGANQVGVGPKDNAMAAAADRSEDPYGTGPSTPQKVLLCSVEKANPNHDELEKFNDNHAADGRFDFGSNVGVHETGLTLKRTKTRAFNGKQVKTKLTPHELPSKDSTGKLGQSIIIKHLQMNGFSDARPLIVKGAGNHYPIDIVQNHDAIEIKSGLVTNSEKAQQWRITFSTSAAEKQRFKSWSKEKIRDYNAGKQNDAFKRKIKALKELATASGGKMYGKTMAALINPETKTADVFSFPGFHQRIGWSSDIMKKGYVASYTY